MNSLISAIRKDHDRYAHIVNIYSFNILANRFQDAPYQTQTHEWGSPEYDYSEHLDNLRIIFCQRCGIYAYTYFNKYFDPGEDSYCIYSNWINITCGEYLMKEVLE